MNEDRNDKTCDAEKIDESEGEGNAREDFSCPYCKKKIRNSGDIIKQMEEH